MFDNQQEWKLGLNVADFNTLVSAYLYCHLLEELIFRAGTAPVQAVSQH